MVGNSSTLRGPMLVLAGSLCFSTSGFLQAIAPADATPYVVAGCRMLIGAAALFLYSILRGRKLNLRGWPMKNVALYAFALWAFQIVFFNSLLVVGVAVGTVVSIGVTPIASGLISWVFEKKAPGFFWYPATLIAIAGLVLINATENLNFEASDLLLPILAGLCYAVEIAVAKPLTEHHTAEESMMFIMAIVGVGLLPFFFFNPVAWIFTAPGFAVTASLGIVTAACAFSLLVAGLKTTAAATASTLCLAEPMGAALLGVLALGEPCSVKTVAGITCIFVAILVLIYGEAHPKRKGKH